jgi:predicted nucleic acid-binding protein
MGIKYLWDTNIAIYFLQQQFPPKAEKFIDQTFQQSEPILSAITEIELLCWKTATEKDLELLKSFIEDSLVIELEAEIKLKTAEIRKLYNLKLPDAIIAATALINELTLLTRNTRDFEKVEGLKVIDPFNL